VEGDQDVRLGSNGSTEKHTARDLAGSSSRSAAPVGSSVAELVQRLRGEQSSGMPIVQEPVAPAPNLFSNLSLSRTAPSEPTGGETPKVGEIAGSVESSTANLAGRTFASAAEVIEHVQKIQKVVEDTESGIIEGEDRFLLFQLLLSHPKTMEKLKGPLKGIRYGNCPHFANTKCFILMFTDGTEEPVGWRKCVKELEFDGVTKSALKSLAPSTAKQESKKRAGGASG